jgi:glutaredoxin-related protein
MMDIAANSEKEKSQDFINLSKNSSLLSSSSEESSTFHLPTMYIKGPLLGTSELIKNLPRKEAVLQITTWNM